MLTTLLAVMLTQPIVDMPPPLQVKAPPQFQFAPASGVGLPVAQGLCDAVTAADKAGWWFCINAGTNTTTSADGGVAFTAGGSPDAPYARSLCPNGPNCANLTMQHFDGVDDRFSSTAHLTPAGDFSVECVMSHETESGNPVFFSQRDGVANSFNLYREGATGNWRFQVFKAVAGLTDLTSGQPTTPRTHNVIGGSYDWVSDGASIMRTYLNGTAGGVSTTAVGPPMPGSTIINLMRESTGGSYMAGFVHSCFYTEKILSADDFARHARAVLADTPTGTKGEALTYTRATASSCCLDADCTEVTILPAGRPCVRLRDVTQGGLQVFRAGTNVVPRSEETDNVAWTKISGGGPVVPTVDSTNSVLAPDGSLTAEVVTWPAVGTGGVYSVLRQNVTFGAAGYLCVWTKKTGGAGTKLWLNNGGATNNAATDCAPTSTWKRCCVSSTVGGTVNIDLGGNGYISAEGPGAPLPATISAAVWGWHAISGDTYASPYVRTTSASVTRNADVASFAGRGIGGPMSVAASVTLPSGWANTTYATIISTYTSSSDYWLLGELTTNERGVEAYPGAKRSKETGALSSSRYWAYQDATNIGAGSGATSYATATKSAVSNGTLNLGNYAGTSFFLDGIISNVCLDPAPARCR